MLVFLQAIFNLIVTLFTSFWNTIVWLVGVGYSLLSEYGYNLQWSVKDYVYNKAGNLSWYSSTARPKSDFIDVYHYGQTVYSAIDSYGDNVEYRTSLIGKVRNYVYNLSGRAQTALGNGWSYLASMLNVPLPKWAFLLLSGIGVIEGYSVTERPTLLSFIPIKTGILDLNTEPKRGFLSDVGSRLYPKLKDFVENSYSFFLLLRERVAQLLFLSAENSVSKIKELITTDYPGIKGLLDIAGKIGGLLSKTPYERLLYLTGEPFEKLLGITSKPEPTIFAILYDKFILWFFGRFYDWLFLERE
jgi:hypothetical protein